MAKRLEYTKRYRPDQTIQIGESDDAPSPFWQIKRQTRERLYRQRPDLSRDEIEQRVNQIVKRGMRPTATRALRYRPSS